MAIEYFDTPRRAFVAMFDVLGFKRLRDTWGTAGIYSQYRAICHTLPNLLIHSEVKTVPDTPYPRAVPEPDSQFVHVRVFSDTLVFATSSDSLNAFFQIVNVAHQFTRSCFPAKMPVRGAIGCGDLIFDRNGLLLGTSIEDAYVGEQTQVWSGCTLTKTCSDFALEQGYIAKWQELHLQAARFSGTKTSCDSFIESSMILTDYSIPCQKRDAVGARAYYDREGWCLDWTKNMIPTTSQIEPFAPTDDVHAERIVQNTLEFEKWARARPKAEGVPKAP